jgi:hypothetical protein
MAYGDPTLYQRGGVRYVQHFAAGRKVRESLHTTDEATAIRRSVALRRKRERICKVGTADTRMFRSIHSGGEEE